jgi:hypothetical protein
MRALLGTLLGTIALGVLLIAYGLLGPRGTFNASSIAPMSDHYQLVRTADRRVLADTQGLDASAPLQLQCESGQRAVIRQGGGASAAACVDVSSYDPYRSVRSESYQRSEPRYVRTYQASPPQRPVTHVARGSKRDWQHTALVVGGSTATAAGLGGIFGGKKGALIGAAIGGGASTLFEALH